MPHDKEPERDGAQRACDSCRARKVRCDKGSPCSHCRSSGSICRTTTAQSSEPRSRVIISKEYEKKIDRIGDRLVNIEKLLQRQTINRVPVLHEPAIENDTAYQALPTPETAVNQSISTTPVQHVDSVSHEVSAASTESHTVAASMIIEQAIGSSPGAYQNHELAAALTSLRDMVARLDEGSGSNDRHGRLQIERISTEKPSPAEIDDVLFHAETSMTMTMSFSPTLTMSMLKERCHSVLRNGRNSDAMERVWVFSTMCNLCNEFCSFGREPAFIQRCNVLRDYFVTELEQAVHDLKFIIPVTADAAYALTVATAIFIERCKPYLAQMLCVRAAAMIVALGYNRISSMATDTAIVRETKIRLFWMAYWLDTSFSVRLGYSPVMRDYDITVPRMSFGSDSVVPNSFIDAWNFSIDCSKLQCQTVEALYSPLALQQPIAERQKRAARLEAELHAVWSSRESSFLIANAEPYAYPHLYPLHMLQKESDAVMHFSTVALVRHATSSASSESPALESARQALKLGIDAWNTFKGVPDMLWSGHCAWTLLKAPITPFTVTFCHVIANPFTAHDDLRLLVEHVATLKELRRFSSGMAKLYGLCDVFCKVATLYVQAKEQEANQKVAATPNLVPEYPGQPALDDIDGYLTTLGFAPPTATGHGAPGAFGGEPEFDASFLIDWYAGNSSLMSFLEQDTFPGTYDL